MNTAVIITIVVVVIILVYIILTNNNLIAKNNTVTNAFSSIDVMLKERYDLIPNLVETVKQYMIHEKETLSKITELRTKAGSANIEPNEKIQLENQISQNMRGIMLAVENYPDLKASDNFIKLQAAWNEIEDRIQAARRTYNAAVNDFNNSVEMFPSNLIAGMKGFKTKASFEIPVEERKNISAKELFNS